MSFRFSPSSWQMLRRRFRHSKNFTVARPTTVSFLNRQKRTTCRADSRLPEQNRAQSFGVTVAKFGCLSTVVNSILQRRPVHWTKSASSYGVTDWWGSRDYRDSPVAPSDFLATTLSTFSNRRFLLLRRTSCAFP